MAVHHGQTAPMGEALAQEHPLRRADADVHAAAAQLSLTAVFVAACAIVGGPATSVLLLLGGMALAVLGVRLAVCMDTRRIEAVTVIAAGGERLPVAIVQRVRRDLLGRRRLAVADRLSMALEDALAFAEETPPATMSELPLIVLQDEIVEVVGLLRASDVESARGVALAERLLGDGTPGGPARRDVMELRLELGRIRYLLRETRSDGAGAPR
jgi:hypothetical protein